MAAALKRSHCGHTSQQQALQSYSSSSSAQADRRTRLWLLLDTPRLLEVGDGDVDSQSVEAISRDLRRVQSGEAVVVAAAVAAMKDLSLRDKEGQAWPGVLKRNAPPPPEMQRCSPPGTPARPCPSSSRAPAQTSRRTGPAPSHSPSRSRSRSSDGQGSSGGGECISQQRTPAEPGCFRCGPPQALPP